MGGEKRPTSFRFSRGTKRVLDRISENLGISRQAVVEVAIHYMNRFWMGEFQDMTPQLFDSLKEAHASLGTALQANPSGVPPVVHDLHTELGAELSAGIGGINWQKAIAALIAILSALAPVLGSTPVKA